jgi:phosphate:Na+ symporter
MVGFEAAAAFVIGSNVGTTVTALLGAIGGIPDKKRTAMAHMIFNLSTGLVALLLMKWLVISINTAFPHLDGVVKIALFHTIFNVIGVVLWYPLIPLLSTFVQKFFRKEPMHVTRYIQNVSTDVPDLALDALEKETMDLAQNIEEFALLAINIPPPQALEKEMPIDKILEYYNENFDLTYDKLYASIRLQEGEIYRYISRLSTKNMRESQQAALDTLSRKVTYLATAAKAIEDMLSDLDRLYDASSNEEQAFYKNLRYQILKGVVAYHKAREGDSSATVEMEEIYKKIAKSYRNSMKLIENMARNRTVSSEMTTIAINDMHLVKSFTKSLKNTIVSVDDTIQKGDFDV